MTNIYVRSPGSNERTAVQLDECSFVDVAGTKSNLPVLPSVRLDNSDARVARTYIVEDEEGNMIDERELATPINADSYILVSGVFETPMME